MKKVIIEPGYAIGPVLLGMSRADVARAVGKPSRQFQKHESSARRTDVYLDYCLNVDFSETAQVEFIEAFPLDGVIHMLTGIRVFETPAEGLLAALSSKADLYEAEKGVAFVSYEVGIALLRSSAEQPHFETVSVAKEDYLKRAFPKKLVPPPAKGE